MAAVTENPIIVDLTQTYGSMIVGCFLSCIIWGASSLQTFIYFVRYDLDHWSKKGLILFLWILDTVNQIVVLMSMWPTLIKNYGSIAILSKIQFGLIHHAWIAQILECCVQMYFIHRLWIYSKKKWPFPAFMILCSVFQLVVLIPYDILTLVHTSATTGALSTHQATSFIIGLRAVTAFEDCALSFGLIYLLCKDGLPQYQKSRSMLVRLLVVTVNTGLWTAFTALMELILVAVYPSGLQYTIVEFPLCSLYFSSLLASLNAREFIRGDTTTPSWNQTPAKLVSSHNSSSRSAGTTTNENLMLTSVTFTRTTECDTDITSKVIRIESAGSNNINSGNKVNIPAV